MVTKWDLFATVSELVESLLSSEPIDYVIDGAFFIEPEFREILFVRSGDSNRTDKIIVPVRSLDICAELQEFKIDSEPSLDSLRPIFRAMLAERLSQSMARSVIRHLDSCSPFFRKLPDGFD